MPRVLTQSSIAPRTLSETPVALRAGLFPPFYPGPTAYPGRGSALGGAGVTPRTLTETTA
jgi:hypothetical protein